MNGVIIFHPDYKEKCYGHYCFFWTLAQLYHSFLRGCQKKLKGLNIWPFTGITSTIAYSTESTEVAVATMNFLLWDANCGLIATFNPICLGQSSKYWVLQHSFMGQCQIFCHEEEITERNLKKRKKERRSYIWNAKAVRNINWSWSKWVLPCESR